MVVAEADIAEVEGTGGDHTHPRTTRGVHHAQLDVGVPVRFEQVADRLGRAERDDRFCAM
jgi:hypothetical protein